MKYLRVLYSQTKVMFGWLLQQMPAELIPTVSESINLARYNRAKYRCSNLAQVASMLWLCSCASPAVMQPMGVFGDPSLPDWVRRGARVEDGRIYGVGIVSNINDPALALTTAQNRGRAEISRMVNTYSASLMKDFASSTTAGDMSTSDEMQGVEQAIRTYSANLLQGTEQHDTWSQPGTNTLYVLMMLDFERSKSIAASSLSGQMKQWVKQNQERVLEELEADMKRQAPPPSAPLAFVQPLAPRGDVAPSRGSRPAWVDGNCDRIQYVCASGEGSEPTDADNRARTALALVFQASIKSVSKSFQQAQREAGNKTGEDWRELERVSEYSMVSADKMMSRAEILERWAAPDRRYWSLAVIDRQQATADLTARIKALDERINRQLAEADRVADKLAKLPYLRRALAALGEREAHASDLRVIAGARAVTPYPYSWRDILNRIEDETKALVFGVFLSGPGAEEMQVCLEEAITGKGFELETSEVGSSFSGTKGLYDVIIQGTIRTDERGRVARGEVVQTRMTLKLINGQNGKNLQTVNGALKATRRSVDAAVQTSLHKLCRQKVPVMMRDVSRYFH